jgi:hypothetical protein
MRPLASLALLGLLGAACATPGEPAWLTEARAREAAPLAAAPLQSKDRFFRARVPAKLAAPIVLEDDAYRVSFDVGASAPIDCWVYRDGIDMAASLVGLSNSSFAAISESLGEVQQRQIERVDAGAIGESPFLAVDWFYRIQSSEGPQVGLIKHLAGNKRGRGVYCQHNEIGYTQTFRRVVDALLKSLEYQKALGPKPYFSQVSTLAVRGMRVGVEHTTLTRDADGDTRVDTGTSLLMPVTGDTLQANDSFGIEFARPNGSLINQVHVESDNGQVVTHLELAPQGKGAWSVQGKFQTKEFAAQIEPTSQPASWLGETLAVRKALATKGIGGEVTLARWVPDADPSRLLDQTISIESQMEPDLFGAKLALAGIEAKLVVNRTGLVTSGSVEMGPASMDFEQVFVSGKF